MAGTIVVDRIESDSSYTSTINVASKVNFTGGMQVGGVDSALSGFRNKVHNGALTIQQKSNTSVNLSSTGTLSSFFVDRFSVAANVLGANSTVTLSTDVPNSTFSKSLTYTVVSANTSSQATDQYALYCSHAIEGYDTIEFAWGTADAKDATLSFWIKAPIVGDYCVAIRSSNYDLSYNTTYTVNQANTWEFKTITFSGPTTGTWNKETGQGILISWDAGYCGPTYNTSISNKNMWIAGDKVGFTSGTIQLSRNASAVGQSIKITGIQFELGRNATLFERRPYATELALCQRFYWQMNGSNGNQTGYNISWYSSKARIGIPTPVPMRSSPTITLTGATSGAVFTTNDDSTYINFAWVGGYGERNGDGHTGIGLNFTAGTSGPGGGILYLQTGRVIAISAEI